MIFESIEQWVNAPKQPAQFILATNGCFDLIHWGHVAVFKVATAPFPSTARRVVVGVNSDASVKRIKGETRPIMNQWERAGLLDALEMVDDVVIFEGNTAANFLNAVKPGVWFKGSDYTLDNMAQDERSVLAGLGTDIKFIDAGVATRTSEIVTKIKGIEETPTVTFERLKKNRDTKFPAGTPVKVNHGRYHGPGVAVVDVECPPNKVAVRLENGNVWWYESETVTPS